MSPGSSARRQAIDFVCLGEELLLGSGKQPGLHPNVLQADSKKITGEQGRRLAKRHAGTLMAGGNLAVDGATNDDA
ncbi:hypothetical protein U9M48_012811 [Paspalum notatum var. saurae]|uniref:Uncharacterized protein n=1 Tax=Paspalum notatum var. saurae TaxID=547442 RepID=A0AAQ3SYG0_PASNO